MSPAFETGEVFAGYRIEGVLGRGGMGVVYRAEDLHLGRTVALKVLAPERADDPAFRDRFLRESRLLASIDHRNIVDVFHAEEVDGLLFLAMRYIEGFDLGKLLDQQPQLEPAVVGHIIREAAEALDEAHSHGLVHRDVKPGNVLISPRGRPLEEARVYLSDFGLTKRTGAQSQLTTAGQFLGTPAYVAPEQIQGSKVDGRADLYALACVAFECLAGNPPYHEAGDAAMLMAHLVAPPPDLSATRPDLPPEVARVIATGMAKSRDQRPDRCADFAAALEAALAPAISRPATTAPAGAAVAPAAAVPSAAAVAPAAAVPQEVPPELPLSPPAPSVPVPAAPAPVPAPPATEESPIASVPETPADPAATIAAGAPTLAATPVDPDGTVIVTPAGRPEEAGRSPGPAPGPAQVPVAATPAPTAAPQAPPAPASPSPVVGAPGPAPRAAPRAAPPPARVVAPAPPPPPPPAAAGIPAQPAIPPQRSPETPDGTAGPRRRTLVGAAVVGVALVAVAGIAFAILPPPVPPPASPSGSAAAITGGAPTPLSTQAASTATPDPGPTVAVASEARLLEMIPEVIRSSCARPTSRVVATPQPVAVIACQPTGHLAPTSVTYSMYATDSDLDDAYSSWLAEALQVATLRNEPTRCATVPHTGGYGDFPHGSAPGKLICYTDMDGRAVFDWSVEVLRVMTRAVRDDGNAQQLYEWWFDADRSGPLG